MMLPEACAGELRARIGKLRLRAGQRDLVIPRIDHHQLGAFGDLLVVHHGHLLHRAAHARAQSASRAPHLRIVGALAPARRPEINPRAGDRGNERRGR